MKHDIGVVGSGQLEVGSPEVNRKQQGCHGVDDEAYKGEKLTCHAGSAETYGYSYDSETPVQERVVSCGNC